MTQLIAGLIGVVLGALVSEGLRARSERRRQHRALTGARRLLLEEVLTAASVLDTSGPNGIRKYAKIGTLSDEVWLTYRALLAEQLETEDWSAVSRPFWLLRLLLSDLTVSDEVVEELADRLKPMVEESKRRLTELEIEAL
jgi:hypothetical protein